MRVARHDGRPLGNADLGAQVADALAAWLDQLLEGGLRADAVWLVGQSLGAHLAGRAAASMTSRPARITGLDPAGPLFWTPSPLTRLSREQAAFVDVVHTDAGWHGLGVSDSAGHADFWPNYGTAMQPGCTDVRKYAGAAVSASELR